MRTRSVHAVTRLTLVLGGALGVVATLAFPAIGSAAITSTTITSPTGPWYAIDNAQAASDPTVTGTTNSTDAGVDQVNLLCTYENTSSNTLASGVALNASGGFTADVPFDRFPELRLSASAGALPAWPRMARGRWPCPSTQGPTPSLRRPQTVRVTPRPAP